MLGHRPTLSWIPYIFVRSLGLSMIFVNVFGPADVIQNGRRNLTKSRGICMKLLYCDSNFTDQSTSHYLKQRWSSLLTDICVNRPRWVNKISWKRPSWCVSFSKLLLVERFRFCLNELSTTHGISSVFGVFVILLGRLACSVRTTYSFTKENKNLHFVPRLILICFRNYY